MNRHLAALSSLVLMTGALVSGCAPAAPNTDPATKVIHAGSVAVLMETENYEGDVGGMGITGKLRLVAGSCVALAYRGHARLIVFPPGTTVEGDGPDTLVIHVQGVDLRLGDSVDAGTRLNDGADDRLSTFGTLATQTPRQCRKFHAAPVDGFHKS